MSTLRPVDGEYIGTEEQRREACIRHGHPLILLNLSLSRPGAEIRRCLCGEVDQAPKPKSRRKR